jgi:uncharacterized protein YndB with AHSA1/START domain
MEPLSHDVTVTVAPEQAFAAFAELAWWPREFTWSGPEALDRVGLEPREGGRFYELGPGGFRCDWGTVTAYEPPTRLAFLWQIGPDRTPQPDPARASDVDMRFTEGDEPGTTRVAVTHTAFERHGAGAQAYRDGMDQGWRMMLDAYAAAAAGR